jgi:hypothetical protein
MQGRTVEARDERSAIKTATWRVCARDLSHTAISGSQSKLVLVLSLPVCPV